MKRDTVQGRRKSHSNAYQAPGSNSCLMPTTASPETSRRSSTRCWASSSP